MFKFCTHWSNEHVVLFFSALTDLVSCEKQRTDETKN